MKKKFLACVCLAFCMFSAGAFASCGESAYDIAVKNGFSGTEQEWLASLKGEEGKSFSMEDAFTFAKNNGFTGTYEDFLREYLSGDVKINNNTYENGSSVVKSTVLSVAAIQCAFTKEVATLSNTYFSKIQKETKTYYSYGAGVFYSLDKEAGDAYVITNYHVVYDGESNEGLSKEIFLYLYGQESQTLYLERSKVSPYYTDYAISATFVGGSATQDIAVLKVEGDRNLKESNARAAVFGDSNGVQIGDSVFTVGNPSAYGIAVSHGIISKESDYTTLSSLSGTTGAITLRELRTDAAVNAGNSGGGLFNEKGELIGIVNAKSIADNVEGMGYALPSTSVKYLVENIIDHCDGEESVKAKKAQFSITVDVAASYSKYDEEADSLTTVEYTRVRNVNAGGAAEGKLLPGDVILALKIGEETKQITRRYELTDFLYAVRKGDTVVVRVNRGGKTEEVEVTFDKDEYFLEVQ